MSLKILFELFVCVCVYEKLNKFAKKQLCKFFIKCIIMVLCACVCLYKSGCFLFSWDILLKKIY